MEKQDWTRYPQFTPDEFDSPDQPGSGNKMQREFMLRLQNARKLARVPFQINSGFRTPEHNKKVGGSPASSHMNGYAADIAATTSHQRFLILDSLIKAGFTRIGVAETFIHADCDPRKTRAVIWTY